MPSNQHEIVPQNVFEDKVTDILSRKEYIHLSGFWEKIKERIIDFLKKMFENNSLDFDDAIVNILDNKIWFYIGLMILVLIAVVILIKILNRFQRNPLVKEILGEKIHKTTTPDSLRQKANAYRTQGDLTQAVRLDFIALLLLMHEKRLLYLEESKTNKEIEKAIEQKKLSSTDQFHYLSETFNAAWYGKKTCDDKIYTSWLENMDFIWKEVICYEE